MSQVNHRRLGRGLEALLGPSAPESGEATALPVREVPVDSIEPNPYQPRDSINPQALQELEESLKTSGLLQPIVVRPSDGGRFQLIAGERRWRAAQALGWNEISAMVREVDDQTLLTLALVENLQRDALSPIDEARGYQKLLEEFGLSQSDVGEMVGRDRTTVANSIRLLSLPRQVQEMVHGGRLSTGHARALLQLKDSSEVLSLAGMALKDQLSVRDLEARVRGERAPQRRPRKVRGSKPDRETQRVEDVLREHLKTDVFVKTRSKQSGKITINFYSNDDLARLLEIILGREFDG